MKCQVCNRDLAHTLSICPTCGAMINDTVREELQPKVATSGNLPKFEPAAITVTETRPYVERPNRYAVPPPASTVLPPDRPAAAIAVPAKRIETAGLAVAKTSPTLVEFQNKNTSLPDWRLQMQNAVRQRKGNSSDGVDLPIAAAAPQLRTNGANALKAEPLSEPIPENADPRLNAALRRIADSRSSFLPAESEKPAFAPRANPPKNFRFDVIEPTPNAAPRSAPSMTAVNVLPKPTLVASVRAEKLDTNKLPKLGEIGPKKIQRVEDISKIHDTVPDPQEPEFESIKRIFINAESVKIDVDQDHSDFDEIEDLAPFPMRFNAGLFDLIIGSVVTMALLSPLALSSGNWVSISGLLTFIASLSIVMFVYLTTSVGFYGKTIGMRIFSLEIVDAEENEYPTIHQAAIHSAIYLISLGLCGVGFATVFFNEENRAIHDLLSGTIIVREF